MNYIITAVIAIITVAGGFFVQDKVAPNVGASQPISSLTELTSLSHDDVLPITDTANATTKKVKWGTATSTLRALNDAIYSPIFSTSAGLAALISDETGSSGGFVRAGSPTLTSPVISSLSSLSVGSDATGDMYYRNASGNFVRLAMPSGSGYYLNGSTTLGVPNWDNNILTNPYSGAMVFTATTTLATTTINGSNAVFNFGGDGSDGVLSITSGTTTINLLGNSLVDLNYSSISITGTGALAFSNPASGGTTIFLRSKGACTITSSSNRAIDISGLGGAGGTAPGSAGAVGNAGAQSGYYLDSGAHYGGGGGLTTTVGVGGAAASSAFLYASSSEALTLLNNRFYVIPGSGGGSGGRGGVSTAGAGGRGAGALVLYCADTYNFASGSTIYAAGGSGNNATNAANSPSGGGGGGAGGFVVAVYGTLIANAGTVTVTGGAGGNGGTGDTNPGYAGGGGGALLGAGSNGTAGSISNGGNGGTGATGLYIAIKNTIF